VAWPGVDAVDLLKHFNRLFGATRGPEWQMQVERRPDDQLGITDLIAATEGPCHQPGRNGIVNLRHSSWMPDDVAHYPRYRFPPAIISHAVWLYYRFTLSFRDVEDLLAQRGITVSY
jgi:hypothetical protein